DVARDVVPLVEAKGIDTLQTAHRVADPAAPRLDEQMRVRRHQRKATAKKVLRIGHLADELEIRAPVLTGQEDSLAADTAGCQVVQSRLEVAWQARHASNVAWRRREILCPRRSAAQSCVTCHERGLTRVRPRSSVASI